MVTPSLPAPTDRHVTEAVHALVQAFRPVRVVLFGSLARGDARPGSDLDLLVVLPHVENHRASALAVRRVLTRLPVPVDIVVTTPEEAEQRHDSCWHVVGFAQREGRVVYDSAS